MLIFWQCSFVDSSSFQGILNMKAIHSSRAVGMLPLFLASAVCFAIKDANIAARAEVGIDDWFPLDNPSTPERMRMSCLDEFTQPWIFKEENCTWRSWYLGIFISLYEGEDESEETTNWRNNRPKCVEMTLFQVCDPFIPQNTAVPVLSPWKYKAK